MGKRTNVTGNLVMIVISTSIALAMTACSGDPGTQLSSNRLDAEEAGYNVEFGRTMTMASSAALELFSALHEARKQERLKDKNKQEVYEGQAIAHFERLRALADEKLAALCETLPPRSMAEVHERLMSLLEESQDSSEPLSIEDVALDFHNVLADFDEQVNNRPLQQSQSTGTINLAVTVGLPVGLTVGAGSDFSVGITVGVPPFSLTLSHSNAFGVRKLVIRRGGMNRYFRLDRAFNVFVPTEYGVQVSSEGAEVLLIEVVDKG